MHEVVFLNHQDPKELLAENLAYLAVVCSGTLKNWGNCTQVEDQRNNDLPVADSV